MQSIMQRGIAIGVIKDVSPLITADIIHYHISYILPLFNLRLQCPGVLLDHFGYIFHAYAVRRGKCSGAGVRHMQEEGVLPVADRECDAAWHPMLHAGSSSVI